MIAATVGFSLFSALLNAIAAILQRRATGQVEPRYLFHHRMLSAVIRNRLWLTGIALQVAGFFAQAAALHGGSLMVVAPLLTTDLVFLVALLHFGLGFHMGAREWGAVLLLSIGLGGLLAATNPHGGSPAISFGHWLWSFVIITVLIVAGALSMRRVRSIPVRAILGGATAGLHFAFTAVLTKLVLAQLQNGVWHEFVSWQLYGLIIVGVSSALSMQSMYGSGPLTITQPALEIVEAGAGIAFGLLLFGDHVNHSSGALAAAAVSGFVLFVGIILLASSRRLQPGKLGTT